MTFSIIYYTLKFRFKNTVNTHQKIKNYNNKPAKHSKIHQIELQYKIYNLIKSMEGT